MYNMYEMLQKLCAERKITITDMCRGSGVPRSSIGNLASGDTQQLSSKNVQKLSSYFGVTVDYLLTGEQKEKPAAKSDEREPNVNVFCRGDGTVLKYYIPEEKQAAFITLLESLGEEDYPDL